MICMTGRLAAVLLAFATAFPATPAHAQATGGIWRVVVGFPVGGTSDIVTRLVAEQLREATGETWIAENRLGAGGRVGADAVKAAAPDGRTLMLAPIAVVGIYPHTVKNLSYDPFKDFVAIAHAGSFELALAVGPATTARTLAEFLVAAKADPKMRNFGSPGAGTLPHFFGLMVGDAVGVSMVHVAYKGSSLAINDLLGGQIPAVTGPLSDYVALHRAGRLRVLAHSGDGRSPLLPDAPTFRESGYRDLAGDGWYGVFGPAGLSEATLRRYNEILVKGFAAPAMRDKMAQMSLKVLPLNAAQFAAMVRADSDSWGRVVKASGFTSTN